MSDFPTDAEREAMANVRELTAGLAFGLPPDVEQRVVRDAILTALAPLIRAREAAAWDEGADAAWQRSTPEVNGLHYHWRSSGEPLNPHVRQEADQ